MLSLNPHKLKRKLGRHVKRSPVYHLRSRDENVKFRNPYHKESAKFDHKTKLYFIIITVSLFCTFGFLFFHPAFAVQNIKIDGLQRIDEQELRETIAGIENSKRFFIFPGENYVVLNIDEIKDVIKSRYPVQSIVVQKQFPDNLIVFIEEKISTIIYDNGKNYSYIGTSGNIVEILRKVGDDEWQEKTQITTSTNELGEIETHTEVLERNHKPVIRNIITELGDYPIVYDKRNKNAELNIQVLDSKTVFGIIDWFNLVNKKTDIPFGYVIIDNELGDAVIKTREGWEMQVKLYENVEKQFEELQYILKDKIDRNNLNYINLRYLGKVYWQ